MIFAHMSAPTQTATLRVWRLTLAVSGQIMKIRHTGDTGNAPIIPKSSVFLNMISLTILHLNTVRTLEQCPQIYSCARAKPSRSRQIGHARFAFRR